MSPYCTAIGTTDQHNVRNNVKNTDTGGGLLQCLLLVGSAGAEGDVHLAAQASALVHVQLLGLCWCAEIGHSFVDVRREQDA